MSAPAQSAEITRRIADLRAGYKFASAARQAAILETIAALLAEEVEAAAVPASSPAPAAESPAAAPPRAVPNIARQSRRAAAPRPRRCAAAGCRKPVAGRGTRYCGKEHAAAALKAHYAARRAREAPERLCAHCGKPIERRPNEGPVAYGRRRYCGLVCANLAAGASRRKATGTVNSRKPPAPKRAPGPLPADIECPGNWRIYRATEPTRSAASLTEAKARAALAVRQTVRVENERFQSSYVEIANLDTGQHLIRQGGEWIETTPAGSPIHFFYGRGEAA